MSAIDPAERFAVPRKAAAAPSAIPMLLKGDCPVCSQEGVDFQFRSSNFREDGECSICRSTARKRSLALLLKFKAKARFNDWTFLQDKHLWLTESTGALAGALKNLKFGKLFTSEYFDGNYKSGDIIDGIRHEDLCRSSFASGSLDFVISSDVLEHVPEPYLAFEELHRVLRPGGVHIFTVPFMFSGLDQVRSRILDGKTIHSLEPIYHGDPLRKDGVLVYTIFSYEMLVNCDRLGFSTAMYQVEDERFGIIGDNNLVFFATKRG